MKIWIVCCGPFKAVLNDPRRPIRNTEPSPAIPPTELRDVTKNDFENYLQKLQKRTFAENQTAEDDSLAHHFGSTNANPIPSRFYQKDFDMKHEIRHGLFLFISFLCSGFFDKNDIYLNKIQSTVKIFVARFNVPVKFEFVWSWRGLNQQIDKSRFAAQAVARSDGGGARKETLLARHLVFSRRFRPRSAQKYSQGCAGNGPIATRAGSWGRHCWHQVQLFRFFRHSIWYRGYA